MPLLFIEFINVITGNVEKTKEFFNRMKPIYKELGQKVFNKLTSSDEITKQCDRNGFLNVEQQMRDMPHGVIQTERSNSIDSTSSHDHPPHIKNL